MNTIKALKGLLGAVLLLCTFLCVTIISVTIITVAAADDDAHTHPICGATHTDVGDHTGECAPVTYTAWNGITDITYTDKTAYIYLTDGTHPDDKTAIYAYEAAKTAYDGLFDDEKRMEGDDTQTALNAGTYTLLVQYTDGSTDGEDTFSVTKVAPQISSGSSESTISTKVHSIVLWVSISLICLILLIILIVLIVFLLVSLKKRKQKNDENNKNGRT